MTTTPQENSKSQETPHYQVLRVIGNGAFGVVLEALDTKHNRKVAIKRTLKMGQRVSREYEVLKRLQGCPNVVQLLDFFYS